MPGPRPRILVVDDDADIRTVVGLNLGLVGMDFAEAADGTECLEALSSGSWDAIVLDLMMPGTDGFEVLRRLKEMPLGHTTILVLSARNSPQAALEALKLGAHGIVAKPFSPGAVAQLLEELIAMTDKEREARRIDSINRAQSLDRLGMPTI